MYIHYTDVEKESPFNDRQEYDEQNPTDDQVS